MSHSIETQQQNPSFTEKYDLAYLGAICDNDPAFMQEMIKSFVSEMPVSLSYLQQQAEARCWKEVEETAHKMKPASQFMGLQHTCDMLRQIEMIGKTRQDLEQLPSLLRTVTLNIHHAAQQLQRRLQEI